MKIQIEIEVPDGDYCAGDFSCSKVYFNEYWRNYQCRHFSDAVLNWNNSKLAKCPACLKACEDAKAGLA